MESTDISANDLKLILGWCRYLRTDLGNMFVRDVADFIKELPKELVDAAEKAPLSEQQDHFDIITLLKRENDQIHLGMNAAITICIDEFVHYVQNIDKAKTSEAIENLSLIATNDIEETIVIEGLAGRVAAKINETINDAFLRLQQMIPSLQQPSQLPCHPRMLIQAMLDSMATLSLSTPQKMIVAKLYTPKIDAKKLADIIVRSLQDANLPQYNKTIRNLDHNASHGAGSVADEEPLADSESDSPDNAMNHGNHAGGGQPMGGNAFGSSGSSMQPMQHGMTGTGSSAGASAGYGGAASGQQHSAQSGGTGHADHANNGNADGAMTSGEMTNQGEGYGAGDGDAYATQGSSTPPANASELLQQLGHLKALRQQMSKMPLTPAPKNPMVNEQTLNTPQLDGILEDIQQEQPTVSVRENQKIQSIGEIRNTIRDRLQSDDENVQTIQDKDSDVINLVSLMFDYILDNPNLPTAMKALLARLQIPMLRVALLTPSFFAESHHPARKLLDTLSKSGISWDKAANKDKYYDMLESIVFRVIKEFRSDISIFETLYEELSEFLAAQEKQSERIGDRTRSSEEKKAEATLSKSFVQKQLNERLIGKKLPFAVVKILQNGWWHVLYHTLIRHGRESSQWKNALKVVDALVWSVVPPLTERNQWLDQVNKIQLKLINNLRKGLNQVNFDPLQRSQLLKEIESIHADVIKEKELDKIDVTLSEIPAVKPDEDSSEAPPSPSITHVEISKPEPTTGKADATQVSLPSDQPLPTTPSESESKPVDKACLDKVKKLKNGTWVEFKSNTPNPQRCKLVAKIRALDKLVFTNRRGIKVAEVGLTKLARQLESGAAKIIETDDHIVETAISAVISNIDKLEQNTNGTDTGHSESDLATDKVAVNS